MKWDPENPRTPLGALVGERPPLASSPWLHLLQGLQKFATENGLANSALLPERTLELVWQAAKIKESLGGGPRDRDPNQGWW